MKTKILAGFTRSRGPGHRAPGLALAAAEEPVAFMAALRTTALYRTDHSILAVGFVMIMTASSVIILCSGVTPPFVKNCTLRGNVS
jgi:hypothetical protein